MRLLFLYKFTYPSTSIEASDEKIEKEYNEIRKDFINLTEKIKTVKMESQTGKRIPWSEFQQYCRKIHDIKSKEQKNNSIPALFKKISKVMIMQKAKKIADIIENEQEMGNSENPITLHTKLCTKDEYDYCIEKHCSKALNVRRQDKEQFDFQTKFKEEHIGMKDCYQYPQYFLKHTSKIQGYEQMKPTAENEELEETATTEFDSNSRIRIDLNQDPKFRTMLLQKKFPKVSALQFDSIENLDDTEVCTLLETMIPPEIDQICLRSNLGNKIKISEKIHKALVKTITEKVKNIITLQGFKMSDKQFETILNNSGHLQKVDIKNCFIFPRSGKEKDPLKINLNEFRKSATVSKLNLSMNKLGAKCLKSVIIQLEGDDNDQTSKLLSRLSKLDISGNQRRGYQGKWRLGRYHYEGLVKNANPGIKLNQTSKNSNEIEDMNKKWRLF
ncbi:unnamed protein product [Moneuplotes crassus]|uniref:Uncharacterized protein n=1 Tax=Euplotes crassus TaxID=5936 RepID=A0AAD1Y3X2_EUPCR|nr:unnamed protein product [Moneuplotes crassus]